MDDIFLGTENRLRFLSGIGRRGEDERVAPGLSKKSGGVCIGRVSMCGKTSEVGSTN